MSNLNEEETKVELKLFFKNNCEIEPHILENYLKHQNQMQINQQHSKMVNFQDQPLLFEDHFPKTINDCEIHLAFKKEAENPKKKSKLDLTSQLTSLLLSLENIEREISTVVHQLPSTDLAPEDNQTRNSIRCKLANILQLWQRNETNSK